MVVTEGYLAVIRTTRIVPVVTLVLEKGLVCAKLTEAQVSAPSHFRQSVCFNRLRPAQNNILKQF